MVLLGALVFILVMSMAAGAMVDVNQTHKQREDEEELLFVGDQYRLAIASYAGQIGVGGARRLPQSLEDLLDDRRTPMSRHHLRRLYPDPMTGKTDWVLVKGGGAASLVSKAAPRSCHSRRKTLRHPTRTLPPQ